MRLTFKCAAALALLLCLSASGCSRSQDAAPGVRTVVSSAPSPQTANAQTKNANAQTENQNARPKVESPLPPPTGFVNDYANVFDGDSKGRLESALTELKEKSAVEFALVTVETTGDQPISDYSLALAKGWGVGPKDASKGGGLLLLLATKDQKWRLQVSRSLEKDLPDAETKKLGDASAELYREGKYAEGVTKYVGALVARLEELRGFKLDRRLTGKPGGKR
ncbi:MAG TPA: TPM domain-containing protein [Pyrinomonadaceae bacterium]|jgi:uncharacterized membrane protein YgcG|nr:TPM domain-containing protein [Pyrinomonadaceae bacterium]